MKSMRSSTKLSTLRICSDMPQISGQCKKKCLRVKKASLLQLASVLPSSLSSCVSVRKVYYRLLRLVIWFPVSGIVQKYSFKIFKNLFQLITFSRKLKFIVNFNMNSLDGYIQLYCNIFFPFEMKIPRRFENSHE